MYSFDIKMHVWEMGAYYISAAAWRQCYSFVAITHERSRS